MKEIAGQRGRVCVQRQDEGGAFGVRVPHVEVEDVYVVRAHEGGDLGEDAGPVLHGDGYLHVIATALDEDAAQSVVRLARLLEAPFHALAVGDLTSELRHRPGERAEGLAKSGSVLRQDVRPEGRVRGPHTRQV